MARDTALDKLRHDLDVRKRRNKIIRFILTIVAILVVLELAPKCVTYLTQHL